MECTLPLSFTPVSAEVGTCWKIYIIQTARISCQKGPICHAQAWRVGPFWQDTIDIYLCIMIQIFHNVTLPMVYVLLNPLRQLISEFVIIIMELLFHQWTKCWHIAYVITRLFHNEPSSIFNCILSNQLPFHLEFSIIWNVRRMGYKITRPF